jgi:hypothetical protein
MISDGNGPNLRRVFGLKGIALRVALILTVINCALVAATFYNHWQLSKLIAAAPIICTQGMKLMPGQSCVMSIEIPARPPPEPIRQHLGGSL